MKKEIAKLWSEALRSGKYKQTKRRLRKKDSFCCLGVLCDLSSLGKWSKEETYGGNGFDALGFLPQSVMDWSGMENELGEYGHFQDQSLSRQNDCGKSFSQIADTIDTYWEKL